MCDREDKLPQACPVCNGTTFEQGPLALWGGIDACGIAYSATCQTCKAELIAYDTDEAAEVGAPLDWQIDDSIMQ